MSSVGVLHLRGLSDGSILPRRAFLRRASNESKQPLLGDVAPSTSRRAISSPASRVGSLRRLRTWATLGWSLSFLLLLILVLSHSTAAPDIPKIDLHHFDLVKSSSAQSIRETFAIDRSNSTAGDSQLVRSASAVTIVSSFYQVKTGKKHRISEYHEWLATFLGNVELPIVFFCSPAMSDFIRTLRGDKSITIIDTYESPFEMPPLIDLGGLDWAKAQHMIDPERHLHVPEVYGVWTAKPWMVKHVKDINIYDSRYFFWADAGAFREAAVQHTFRGLSAALDAIYKPLPSDTLLLASTEVPFPEGTEWVKAARRTGDMDRRDYLQGGWFGGPAAAVDWWAEEILAVTKLQGGMLRFSAKEQPIWTQTARLNWQRIYVQNMAYREGDCGPDKWFTFEYIADGRDCRVPAWSGPAELAKAQNA